MLDSFYTSLFLNPADKSAHLILADYLEMECDKKDLADTHRYFVDSNLYPQSISGGLEFLRFSRRYFTHTITDTLLFALLKRNKPEQQDSIIFPNFRTLTRAFTTALRHYKKALSTNTCFQISKSMWVNGERVMIRTVAPYGLDKVDYYVILPSYHEVVGYRPTQLCPKHLLPQIVSDFACN